MRPGNFESIHKWKKERPCPRAAYYDCQSPFDESDLVFSSCQTVDDFFAVNGMAQEKCWKQEKRGLQETEHPQKKHGVQTFAKFS